MDHRYGRHGPHAWLRRQQHRFSRYFPVSTVVTACHQLPIYTERIIIIVIPSNNLDEREDENTSSLVSHEIRVAGLSQNEYTQMYAALKTKAEFEAEAQFDKDYLDVCRRGVEWPTEELLRGEARVQADTAIKDYVRPGFDREGVKKFFVDNYLRRYREEYEKLTGDSSLNNEELIRLKRSAKLDAMNDKEDGIKLDEEKLNYQAAIHIQHFFGGTTRASGGYLERVMEHIPHYKQAYREEMDRAQRSAPFPGGWQSVRTGQL